MTNVEIMKVISLKISTFDLTFSWFQFTKNAYIKSEMI